jgi:HSP20 family protein
MTLIRWKPTNDLASWTPMADLSTDLFSMQGELNRIFDRFFNHGATDDNDLRTSTWYPSVDVTERDDAYVMKAELPGVSRGDVKITLKDNLLTIHGEKKRETEEKDKNYFRNERHYGVFQRTFTLPSKVHGEKINANFTNGVLTIEIPKAEDAKPKEIEVKVS